MHLHQFSTCNHFWAQMGCQDKDWLMQTVLTLLWGQNWRPVINSPMITMALLFWGRIPFPLSFPPPPPRQNHNQCEAASVPKSSSVSTMLIMKALFCLKISAFVECVPTKMIILSMWSPLVRAGTGSTVKFANTTSVCIPMITPGSV